MREILTILAIVLIVILTAALAVPYFIDWDAERSLVGSYNLDPRSERLNSETAIVFLEPESSSQLRRAFLDNDLRYSHEVTPEMAATFESPESAIERFRKSIGDFFEDNL